MNIKNIFQHKYITYLNAFLFSITIIGYCVLSFVEIQEHIPNFDEIHAWNISLNCSFSELFAVARHDGHFILWFLLLKPLSLYNINYPWSMYILNWTFAFSAVLLLWWKAPFNPLIKMFITFSVPMQILSIYARCYAIGGVIMFAICALYPQRKQRPILYPFLIMLLANTSVMATIAAFCFGLLYCYELLVDLHAKKITLKDCIRPLLIFSLGSIFMLFQKELVNMNVPYYSLYPPARHNRFFNYFKMQEYWPRNIEIILKSFLIIFGFVFFIKDKKPYIFVLFSTSILLGISYFIYTLYRHHYIFLFIFLTCAMWIYLQENKIKTYWQKIYYILFMLLSFLEIFYYKYPWVPFIWIGCNTTPLVSYLTSNMDKYKGAKIFMYPPDPYIIGIIPQLRNYDINFYGPHGTSYKSYKTYTTMWLPKLIDFEAIKTELLSEPTKINNSYIFVYSENRNKLFLETYNYKNYGVHIEFYNKVYGTIIYKLSLE